MDEATWLSSDDPGRMVGYLEATRCPGTGFPARASDRKLRLFAAACCRLVWHLLADPRSRQAVEAAEAFADGLATRREMYLADRDADRAVRYDLSKEQEAAMVPTFWVCHDHVGGLPLQSILAYTGPPAAQAALLREVFGNPFRPARLRCRWCGDVDTPRPECALCGADFGWLPGGPPTDLLRLAGDIYGDRDFAALPALADALEEAGAEDGPLLRHLRGQEVCPGCAGTGVVREWVCLWPNRKVRPECRCDDTGYVPLRGPHARGCWALDLILGKG